MDQIGANHADLNSPYDGRPPFTLLQVWDEPSVPHGFMGRTGGVSDGAFASFNLAGWVGDRPEAVAENWRHWHRLNPELTPVRSHQVHGTHIRIVEPDDVANSVDADGMVTAAVGLALCIFTADCVPLLMLDSQTQIAAAIHAGWRGTLGNIAGAGVRAMVKLGARREAIRAALGPAIGLCCFEVDEVLADRFVQELPAVRAHRRPGRGGKAYLDLRGINRDQLAAQGIAPDLITTVGACTRCAHDQFFSRRAAGGTNTGLQISFIGITA
jgi:YfiH family protein